MNLVDQWTLVAAGLVAHADRVLEVGEWEAVTALISDAVAGAELDEWLAVLSDRAQLEARMTALEPLAGADAELVLRRAWRIALSDGSAAEVEQEVHDHIARALGVDEQRATTLRDHEVASARREARATALAAAWLANIDGRMDSGEAVEYDVLLQRLPLEVSERVELAAALVDPPVRDQVLAALREVPSDRRDAVLDALGALVNASARGDDERAAIEALRAQARD